MGFGYRTIGNWNVETQYTQQQKEDAARQKRLENAKKNGMNLKTMKRRIPI